MVFLPLPSFYTLFFVMFHTKITDKLQVLAMCSCRTIIWPYPVVLNVLTTLPCVNLKCDVFSKAMCCPMMMVEFVLVYVVLNTLVFGVARTSFMYRILQQRFSTGE